VNDASASGGLSKTRIEALTDGIFAIAMTLMVFDIKLPAPTQTTPWSLHYELIRLWPRFLAYTISFIMLDVYWVHRRTDRGFLWINVFFLMGVSLLPFSTGLLGQYPAVRTALVVYGLNLIMVGGFLYALVVRDAQPPARRESYTSGSGQAGQISNRDGSGCLDSRNLRFLGGQKTELGDLRFDSASVPDSRPN